MDTSENTVQTVGRVVVLFDNAKAISPDGMERNLSVGSPVFANDSIITQGEGRISIFIDDSDKTQIDLESKSEILIDEDIFGGVSAEEIAGATAGIEQVQEAFFIEGVDLPFGTETADTAEGPAGDFDRLLIDENISNNTAGQNASEFFDHSDYSDLDNANQDDPLGHLLDTDDITS